MAFMLLNNVYDFSKLCLLCYANIIFCHTYLFLIQFRMRCIRNLIFLLFNSIIIPTHSLPCWYSGSVPWCSTSVGSIVNILCHYPVLSKWCQDLFYHEPLFHQCYTCTICQMVTLQLVNLATKIMIIFHLTIYMIHYLYFFLSFMDGFSTFLKNLLLVSKENRNFAPIKETLIT